MNISWYDGAPHHSWVATFYYGKGTVSITVSSRIRHDGEEWGHYSPTRLQFRGKPTNGLWPKVPKVLLYCKCDQRWVSQSRQLSRTYFYHAFQRFWNLHLPKRIWNACFKPDCWIKERGPKIPTNKNFLNVPYILFFVQ